MNNILTATTTTISTENRMQNKIHQLTGWILLILSPEGSFLSADRY